MNSVFKAMLKEAWRQIVGSSKPKHTKFVFTKNALLKMREHRLTEQYVIDTYHRGRVAKPGMVIRDYNGYHIGLFCKTDSATNAVVIISCWKRKS